MLEFYAEEKVLDPEKRGQEEGKRGKDVLQDMNCMVISQISK
jgi:hypothetical protein